MTRRITLYLTFTLLFATVAMAQDYPAIEVYAGLARARQEPNFGTLRISEHGEQFALEPCGADAAEILGPNLQKIFCDRRDFHGFDTSVKYNLSRWIGVRGDFSMFMNEDRATDAFGEGAERHVDTNVFKERTYLLAGGIQVGDNSTGSRFRPFAHALVGVARQTSKDEQTSVGGIEFRIRDTATSFTFKVGAGLDVPVSNRVSVRLIEANYVPIFARDRHTPGTAPFDQSVAGRTAKNVTFSFGIVVH